MSLLKKYNLEATRISLPLLTFALLVLLEPAFCKQAVDAVDTVYNLFQILVAAAILIRVARRGEIDLFIALMFLYYAILLFATLLNEGEVKTVVIQAASFITLCLLVCLTINKQCKDLLTCIRIILEVYVYINLIVILLFPDGAYSMEIFDEYYFLGYKNQMINFMLPALGISLIHHDLYHKKEFSSQVRIVLLLVACLASAVLADSSGSTVLMGLMVLFVLLKDVLPKNVFNARFYLVLNIVMFFCLVVFQMQYIFSDFITALGRDLTLTGRTYIWEKTWSFVEQSPLIGHGVVDYNQRVSEYLALGSWGPNAAAGLHAHDRFLETLYRGGILLLFVYLLMLVISTHRMYVERNNSTISILAFLVFVYLTGMLTEFYEYSPFFFVFLYMGFRSRELINSCNLGSIKKEKGCI